MIRSWNLLQNTQFITCQRGSAKHYCFKCSKSLFYWLNNWTMFYGSKGQTENARNHENSTSLVTQVTIRCSCLVATACHPIIRIMSAAVRISIRRWNALRCVTTKTCVTIMFTMRRRPSTFYRDVFVSICACFIEYAINTMSLYRPQYSSHGQWSRDETLFSMQYTRV